MHNVPDDMVFKIFYYIGYLYMIGGFFAGSYITYDWFRNRRKGNGDN